MRKPTGPFHEWYPKLPWDQRVLIGVGRFGYAHIPAAVAEQPGVDVEAFASKHKLKITKGTSCLTLTNLIKTEAELQREAQLKADQWNQPLKAQQRSRRKGEE